MSNRMPSLLALLGLAAAAGYQNRDSLKSMLDRSVAGNSGHGGQDRVAQSLESRSDDGTPYQPEGGLLGSLQTGLSELVNRFTAVGSPEPVQSWVGTGQNVAVTPDQLRTVLGDDVISEMTRKTGLSEVDLLARLAQVLPDTVDQLTPDGVVPAAVQGSSAGQY